VDHFSSSCFLVFFAGRTVFVLWQSGVLGFQDCTPTSPEYPQNTHRKIIVGAGHCCANLKLIGPSFWGSVLLRL